ncbi:serine/threonine protein kinase [Actinomadura darangshiensis]|uniref:Serine/threonine protein kinase n=1 Tax=Actinomadura darangshiensis TaxID=705336 RepID=A0A4V2YVJ3_9ACTN|nr:peptidylprolyl isomerase [Actinomadura darangshiensis]TDD81847.1 serine/threonine protein kinase [Actinomadura darangshiensis]
MPESRPLRSSDPREVGGFRLTARIGEGAQGVVYLGESDTGEQVAAKVLHADIGRDDRARTLFERELAAARSVAPFCTARILAAEADGELPYIISEYIDGPSLRERIAADGAATPSELVRLAIGTATALAAIHEADVVHRDFKPANVLLGPDGPKVIDFGVAKTLEATSATLTGAVGTPAYMAPEQVEGAAGGAPLDMFAWGCTMAFAANGVPPFGGASVPAIMQRILYGEPELGALTGDLRALVASCLAKDPAGRPTAIQVLQRLLGTGPKEDLLAEGTTAAALPNAGPLPGHAPPNGMPPAGWGPGMPGGTAPGTAPPTGPYPWSPPAPGRGRPLLIAGAAAAALVLLAGGATAAVLLNNGDDKDKPEGGRTPLAQSPSAQTTGPSNTTIPPKTKCDYPASTIGTSKNVGTPPTSPSATLPSGATIKTNLGTLELTLDTAKAPCTVNSLNFLASKKFYDRTSCHRLTTDASLKVLQCGDPTGGGSGGPGYKFANENTAGASYKRGTVAMANAGPNTNGSQFFIVYADAKLPADYPVLGHVTSGMEIVDEVAKGGAGDDNGPGDGKPKKPITITEFRTAAG